MRGLSIRTWKGRNYTLLEEIGAGYQGTAWRARDRGGDIVVVKLFAPAHETPETRMRLERLIELHLSALSPSLVGPQDLVLSPHLGYVCQLAGDQGLDEMLRSPGHYTLSEATLLGCQLANALARLEDAGVAHGDLAAANIRVLRRPPASELLLIDPDNAHLGGAFPAPPCAGQEPYLAPELRESRLRGERATPTRESDRFALGVLVHSVREDFAAAACQHRVPEQRPGQEYDRLEVSRHQPPGLDDPAQPSPGEISFVEGGSYCPKV